MLELVVSCFLSIYRPLATSLKLHSPFINLICISDYALSFLRWYLAVLLITEVEMIVTVFSCRELLEINLSFAHTL